MRYHDPIPADFPVKPLRHGEHAEDKATCGHCGLSWDDAIPTTWTPAPSARCPFEYFHRYPEKRRMKPRVTTRCVANTYAARNERIIEFSGETSDQGGLISFAIINGKMTVDIYRQGSDVEIRIGKPDPPTKGV